VIRHVSTTTGFVNLDPELGEPRLAGKDIRATTVAFDAERNNRGMLQEQKEIGDSTGATVFDQLTLHRQRLCVAHQA
jgi:hypothetical protein